MDTSSLRSTALSNQDIPPTLIDNNVVGYCCLCHSSLNADQVTISHLGLLCTDCNQIVNGEGVTMSQAMKPSYHGLEGLDMLFQTQTAGARSSLLQPPYPPDEPSPY